MCLNDGTDMPSHFIEIDPTRCIECGSTEFLHQSKDGSHICEECIQRYNDSIDEIREREEEYLDESKNYETHEDA